MLFALYCLALFLALAWRNAVYSEETLLFFLDDGEDCSDPTLPTYERLKQQQLSRHTNYLLLVERGLAFLWDVSEIKSLYFVNYRSFGNSSRYALISPKVAIVTGGSNSRMCASIDLNTREVTRLSDMLEARGDHGIASFKQFIYVSGGAVEGKISRTTEIFDSVVWRKFADMKSPRCNHTLSPYKSALYAFGGSDANGLLNSIELCDGNQWQLSPIQLPLPSSHLGVVCYKQKLVLVGGNEATIMRNFVYVWDEGHWEAGEELSSDYSPSNAVMIKGGVCYLYGAFRKHHFTLKL